VHSSRHFLVKWIGDHYHLREIESVLAQSLFWSGAFPWRRHCDQNSTYWFYFVHTSPPCQHSGAILDDLITRVQRETA
jgi:hypothetical protein